MAKIDLSADETNILMQSIRHCLSTCHDGGLETGCPDCQKLETVMMKLQGAVGR